MIDITKQEAEYLRNSGVANDIHMSSRSHGAKAKTYFLTTSPKAMRLLKQYRSGHITTGTKE